MSSEEIIPSMEVGLDPSILAKLNNEIIFTEGVSPTKPMDLVERAVCELRADKKSNMDISQYLGISISEVRRVLKRENVKNFLKDLINSQYELSKEYRLEVISKIITAKINEMEASENPNFSEVTKKDIVDLLMIQDGMLKEREKKELGTNQDTYITLLQQVIKN